MERVVQNGAVEQVRAEANELPPLPPFLLELTSIPSRSRLTSRVHRTTSESPKQPKVSFELAKRPPSSAPPPPSFELSRSIAELNDLLPSTDLTTTLMEFPDMATRAFKSYEGVSEVCCRSLKTEGRKEGRVGVGDRRKRGEEGGES